MMDPVAEVNFGVLCNFSLFLTVLSLPFHPLLSCAEHLESASDNHLEFLKRIIWWDFSSP